MRFLLVYPSAAVCYRDRGPAMPDEDIHITARAIPLLRIIASGIVFAFLYFASSVVMTLLLSAITAYFLEPVVEFLERMRVPRGLGALMVLLAVIAVSRRAGLSGGQPHRSICGRLAALQRSSPARRYNRD